MSIYKEKAKTDFMIAAVGIVAGVLWKASPLVGAPDTVSVIGVAISAPVGGIACIVGCRRFWQHLKLRY